MQFDYCIISEKSNKCAFEFHDMIMIDGIVGILYWGLSCFDDVELRDDRNY